MYTYYFKSELRSCENVEATVLGFPSLVVRTVSVDVKQTELELFKTRVQEEVKVEVAVLGSPSLIVPTVSADVRQH